MTESEMQVLREKYPPQKCENQIEFEAIMSQMNDEQTHINHPFIDKDRELSVKKEELKLQLDAIYTEIRKINLERLELDAQRKEINRFFHDLKHELIMLNPREQFVRPKDNDTSD